MGIRCDKEQSSWIAEEESITREVALGWYVDIAQLQPAV